MSALLARLSYRSGLFTLASGRTSDFYVDVKQTVLSWQGAGLIGSALLDRIEAHGISSAGGMAAGAIPLVSVAVAEASRRSYDLEAFFVRKEAKSHGTLRRLDGRFDPTKPVALLEDVVTTGGSTLAAVDAVEESGGRVELIVAVVDREENQGMAALAARVPKVEALSTRTSIVAAAERLRETSRLP